MPKTILLIIIIALIQTNIDYFRESATYGFLFTSTTGSCKTLENERVSAVNE